MKRAPMNTGRRTGRRFRLLFAGILVLCLGAPGPAQQGTKDGELARILGRMDAVSKGFRSFRANFSQKQYTAVLREFSAPDAGEFYYARAKDGSVRMRHEIVSPGKRILTIQGDTLTVYRPSIKEAQTASREKMRDVVGYLALGIGESSARLREKFDISYKGAETLDGVRCAVLVFVPKEAKTKSYVASITLWLKESTTTPAQYKFEEPSEDYLLIRFSQEKINTPIPDSKFEQKIPKGVPILRL